MEEVSRLLVFMRTELSRHNKLLEDRQMNVPTVGHSRGGDWAGTLRR